MKKNHFAGSRDFRKKLRDFCYLGTLSVLFVFASLQAVQAQKSPFKKYPGTIVVCPANFEDQHSRMAMKQLADRKQASLVGEKKAVTAEITIVFGPGAQGNAEVQEAFRFAAQIWGEEIVSSVPIVVSADFANLGAGVLASAGPSALFQDFNGAPFDDRLYPPALANSLAGERIDPDNTPVDLIVNIGNGIPWYFGLDGNPPAGQFDFVTVALHEMGHGLGFFDGGNVDASGVGSLGFGGVATIFDNFLVDGSGNSVFDFPNPSAELGDFFTSRDVFLNGQFAVAALGGELPEVFAPNPFQGGSSIAHWDEASFPSGDPNSLMTPQVGASESNFDVGDITRGHFRDMGWVLATQSPITINPSIITEELNVEETAVADITITNTSEAAVSVTALAPSNPFVVVNTIDPSDFDIPAGSSAVVTVGLSTEGVAAGIYEELIEFAVDGLDDIFEVSVNVRVLDGTEAPSIVVNPEAFDETMEQFRIETRDLTIENVGNADLNYSITIDGDTIPDFDSRVALTKSAIAANGFKKVQASLSSDKGLASLIRAKGPINRVGTSLFSTGFEDLAIGELNNQEGWQTVPLVSWTVSGANAFEGAQHGRLVTDGFGGLSAAFSPLITPGVEDPFNVSTTRVNLQSTGSSFEIIPQSDSAGSVVTRVLFNADGSVSVLDGIVGNFVPIEATTPTGYFDVRIVVDSENLGMTVSFDGTIVYTGFAFTALMEQVVFLSDNLDAGSTFDFDNVEVIDGDDDVFFLSVSPTAGDIGFGESSTLQVRFDTRALDPGLYNATINVSSNDTANPSIDIPVSLTVTAPPTISVAPNALSAAVDVSVDDPATAIDSFTITNNGESDLDFNLGLGDLTFTPPALFNQIKVSDLDLSKYGVGNTKSQTLQSVKTAVKGLKVRKHFNFSERLENMTFKDSIFYDSGIPFPDTFSGVSGTAVTTAVKFDAESDFTLTAVRNAVRTEAVEDAVIILEIYKGGATPDVAELLLQQTVTVTSADGVFLVEELNEAIAFNQGESFWVVHKYPIEINFPQGQDDDVSNVRPNTYFFSVDGGASYTNLDNFIFLTRALSGDAPAQPYITLSPSSGSVPPGESIDVEVTFDGTLLANGIYESDILVNSNDPVTPTATVGTTFEVSGQTSTIAVSDELLLFNDVFIGNTRARTFTVTNDGLSQLNISEIVSDNTDFVVEPATAVVPAGEELEITVTFEPSRIGSINGTLTIESDATNGPSPIVFVNGIGVDPPIAFLDPQEVFESTPKGIALDTEIVLRNDGNSPLIFSFPESAIANAMADPKVKLSNTKVIDFKNFTGTKEKGFKDTRVGLPVKNGMGTDNAFGYTWIDSDEVGGPIYFNFDIANTGTDITGLVGGDGTAQVDLPFPVTFYGETYESIFVNANGLVSFQPPTNFTFVNGQIPVNDGINNIIAGFWGDIEPINGGAVHVAAFADAFVIQWANVPVFFGDPNETVSFKIIILADGTIDIFYDDVDGASFTNRATVGIENADGTDGALVAFNTPYVKDGLALRFIAPDPRLKDLITNVSPVSGIVPAGGSRTLTVTLDPKELEPGVYLDELTVSSNAPDKSLSTSVIELTVEDVQEVKSFTLINADIDQEIGPLNDGDVIDLADFDTKNFNVTANIGELRVGSIVFDYNGVDGFRTESAAPYALGGDRRGDFRSLELPLGINTLNATPFSERRGRGDAGIAKAITFEVIDTSPPAISLILVNADTDENIFPILGDFILDLNVFPTTGLSVAAETDLDVGSIVFDYNGERIRTDSAAPYALGGDNSGDFMPFDFVPGANTITATAYSERGGRGTVLGTSTANLEVIPVSTLQNSIKIFPNPVANVANFTIKGSKQQGLKGGLYNMFGFKVLPVTLDFDDNGNALLNMSIVPSGIYVLRLTNKFGEIYTVKVKKK